MLYFLTLGAFTTPVGLEASGMQPQIRAIERLAADNGWKATCRGRSGEQQVIRLLAPEGISRQAIEEFSDRVYDLASGVSPIDTDRARSEVCDKEPVTMTTDGASRSLAFGPSQELEPLKTIAIGCGFASTFIRPWRPEDTELIQKQDGLAVLDAGEDTGSRYGPIACYVKFMAAEMRR